MMRNIKKRVYYTIVCLVLACAHTGVIVLSVKHRVTHLPSNMETMLNSLWAIIYDIVLIPILIAAMDN